MNTVIIPSIRHAIPQDIPKLGSIEVSAGALFRTIPSLSHIADDHPQDPRRIRAMARERHVWLAVDDNDEPVAFLMGHVSDFCFHIAEISVMENWQRRRVGSALVKRMEDQVKEEGFKVITLTTFRDVPWNGPWYARMGFEEVDAASIGEQHIQILKVEEAHCHDMTKRCCMSKAVF